MHAVHARFVDSDDDEKLGTLAMPNENPSMSPCPPPPSQTNAFTLMSSISTDYDGNDQCYVLHLAAPSPTAIAAALSNKEIKLYSLANDDLHFVGNLNGHTKTITSLHAIDPNTLLSSSNDGTVVEWDLRSSTPQTRVYRAGNQEIACSSTNGTLIAAGARDNILFWDRLSGRPLTSFTDTHFQDVTQLAFHPINKNVFTSASEDGLIAVFDTSSGLDEDEGFKAALNIDTAVARLGFYGPGLDKLWCCSGTETLHVWEWAAACDDEMVGGNGALGESTVDTTRPLLQFDTSGSDNTHADYLIQCEYDPSSDQLVVVAGTNNGEVGLFPVGVGATGGEGVETATTIPSTSIHFGAPVAVMKSEENRGHCDIVRSVVWVGGVHGEGGSGSGGGSVWVTGGEDARLSVWRSGGGAREEGAPPPQASIAEPIKKQPTHVRRVSPY